MGGCSAEFCNNSSSKGYVMKVFPRDPERRALWAKNVGRENWTPTNNSYLCEVHFAPDMWERNRADGKQKLKPNAVPTIFGFFLKTKMSVAENKNNEVLVESNDANENMLDNDIFNNESINNENEDVEYEIIMNSSEPSSVTVLTTNEEDKKQCEHQNLVEIIQKQYLRMLNMRRKMKALRQTIQTLQTKINNDKYKAALDSIFTEDQIRALLRRKQNIRNWSDETIRRAVQLKSICGNNGYEQLIQQGYPFPSLRTLRRKLEDLKYESEISNT